MVVLSAKFQVVASSQAEGGDLLGLMHKGLAGEPSHCGLLEDPVPREMPHEELWPSSEGEAPRYMQFP